MQYLFLDKVFIDIVFVFKWNVTGTFYRHGGSGVSQTVAQNVIPEMQNIKLWFALFNLTSKPCISF